MDAELVLGHCLHLRADVTCEECLEVVSVAEEIRRGQDRPGRDLVGDVLGRDVAHFQVATLDCHEFGALLEQGAAEIRLERIALAERRPEALHHFGANVLLREDSREAQLTLFLRHDRHREGNCQRRAKQHPPSHCKCHEFLPLGHWGRRPDRETCVIREKADQRLL